MRPSMRSSSRLRRERHRRVRRPGRGRRSGSPRAAARASSLAQRVGASRRPVTIAADHHVVARRLEQDVGAVEGGELSRCAVARTAIVRSIGQPRDSSGRRLDLLRRAAAGAPVLARRGARRPPCVGVPRSRIARSKSPTVGGVDGLMERVEHRCAALAAARAASASPRQVVVVSVLPREHRRRQRVDERDAELVWPSPPSSSGSAKCDATRQMRDGAGRRANGTRTGGSQSRVGPCGASATARPAVAVAGGALVPSTAGPSRATAGRRSCHTCLVGRQQEPGVGPRSKTSPGDGSGHTLHGHTAPDVGRHQDVWSHVGSPRRAAANEELGAATAAPSRAAARVGRCTPGCAREPGCASRLQHEPESRPCAGPSRCHRAHAAAKRALAAPARRRQRAGASHGVDGGGGGGHALARRGRRRRRRTAAAAAAPTATSRRPKPQRSAVGAGARRSPSGRSLGGGALQVPSGPAAAAAGPTAAAAAKPTRAGRRRGTSGRSTPPSRRRGRSG